MMWKKIKQQKGETLVEALVSLLIAVMCMSILTISVTTASKLNRETNRLDEKYSVDLQMAEQHLSDTEEYKAKVDKNLVITFNKKLEQKELAPVTIKVTVYGGEKDDNAFASYEKKEVTAP